MPLNRVKKGSNMYQGFVDFTHSHLAGQCPHLCQYCYVTSMARRFPAMQARYSGPPRLVENELAVDYGKRWREDKYSEIEGSGLSVFKSSTWRTEKTIFVENCSDLFAEGIDAHWIGAILSHCRHAPGNTYVFQTKNPGGVSEFLFLFPPRFIIGTTAESNRHYSTLSNAPSVDRRLYDMRLLPSPRENLFITCEPLLEFDHDLFFPMLLQANVPTIYIGADSKNHGLPEPTSEEIGALIRALRDAGKTVILKTNLKRIYKGE